MSLFPTWKYKVQHMPERSKFTRRPDPKTLDPGEVADWWFEVSRGEGEDLKAVQVRVTREWLTASGLLTGKENPADAMALARGEARVIASAKFRKYDQTIARRTAAVDTLNDATNSEEEP